MLALLELNLEDIILFYLVRIGSKKAEDYQKLGPTTAKAFNDKRCPDFQPDPGWNNTCKQNAGEDGLGIDLVGENPD